MTQMKSQPRVYSEASFWKMNLNKGNYIHLERNLENHKKIDMIIIL
jgi:hypothetical protein